MAVDGPGPAWFNRLMSGEASLLRLLPAVDRLLASAELAAASRRHGHALVVEAARRRLEELRGSVLAGDLDAGGVTAAVQALPGLLAGELDAQGADPYRRVINAAGILVHTNLGRAPLPERAAAAAGRAARHAVALEYELETGRRGSRSGPVREELERLFPGATGLSVTNNAAAVLLALNTFAAGREVILSRGELVEIGGSFRVPEILERSGARLREVGTTNRTRLADYEGALGPETGAILRVHPSNFHQVGFTESAAGGDLARLARRAGVPFIVDQGSGNLHDLAPYGVIDEPTVAEVLEEGADVVTFSGDKLLGGPQAGILVGRREAVERLAANPLARALRPDKLILAALVATLRCHLEGKAFVEIPVLRRLATPLAELEGRARGLLGRLRDAGVEAARLAVVPGTTRTGGGSSPSGEIPTVLLSMSPPPGGAGEETLAARLRAGSPAVVGRLAGGRLLLDLRTVDPDEDERLAQALLAVLRR